MRLSLMTRILIAVLAVIVAYFFLVEEKQRKAAVEKRRSERKLFPFPADSVQKFILVNPGGMRITVERAAAGWKIASPVDTPGDGPAIDSFLGQVVPGGRNEEMPAGSGLAGYGLARPFATVILFRRTGPADTLSVGDQTPTSSNTYVRLGGSRSVFISSSVTHNLVDKSLYLLRDKSFVSFKSESVTSMAVRRGRSTLDLARAGGSWWFGDRRARADRAKVEAYLNQLSGAIIRSFASESDSLDRFGLAKPDRDIALAIGSERLTVSFGATEEDEVYATRTGLDKAVSVEAKLLSAFDWTRDNLRAMNLAFFDPDSVKVIEYRTPDTTLVMRKAGGRWVAAGKDTIPEAKSYIVDALARKLMTLVFTRIVAEPAGPTDRRLSPVALTVSLEDLLGGPIDIVTIARPSPGVEMGSSRSANVLGALKNGTLEQITSIFDRIGERPARTAP